MRLERLTIEGFLSFAKLDFEFPKLASDVTVLVGANGSGKSNVISFFELLSKLGVGQLQRHIGWMGGPDRVFHFGTRRTQEIHASLAILSRIGSLRYAISLIPTQTERTIFTSESVALTTEQTGVGETSFGSGHPESAVFNVGTGAPDVFYLPTLHAGEALLCIRGSATYNFNDGENLARVKRLHSISDATSLRWDGSNLAAFLLGLRIGNKSTYDRIVECIRLVLPAFKDFHLEPYPLRPEKDQIQLEWLHNESDVPFLANQFSDGTLRFITNLTAIMQPGPWPYLVLLDEPELGLHPEAISVLAGAIKSAATEKQIIIATQSPQLVSEFEPENIVVVEHDGTQSRLRRLDGESLKGWLEDYSLGELWQKNVFGGSPGSWRELV